MKEEHIYRQVAFFSPGTDSMLADEGMDIVASGMDYESDGFEECRRDGEGKEKE